MLVAEFTNFYDEAKALELTEQKQYNEYLVTQSSQFLEIISASLQKYGGDLIQFMAYSLVAIWPRPDELNHTDGQEGAGSRSKKEAEFIREVCRKAAQCALDVKREIGKIMGPKVKIIFGIAHGDF